MRIVHRISLSVDRKVQTDLWNLGIYIGIGFESFEIEESNPAWSKLEGLVRQWQAVDVTTTKFSQSELNKAHYLRMCPSWHWGYPQPEDNYDYLKQSFCLSEYCVQCGVGKKQKAPLRIKGEPKWGKKHILQLNWIFDVFLVLPDVWDMVFKPFSIASIPVIDHASDIPLKTVVQLEPQGVVSLSVDELPYEQCSIKGLPKYEPTTKGFFPSLRSDSNLHYMLSEEYFGSGHAAYKAVIISAKLYKSIIGNKLNGVSFVPLAN